MGTPCGVVGRGVSGFCARQPAIPVVKRRVETSLGYPGSTLGYPRKGQRHGRRLTGAPGAGDGAVRSPDIRRRARRPVDKRHYLPVAPNRLTRSFTASWLDQMWQAETSYILTEGGQLYLAAITDVAMRQLIHRSACSKSATKHSCPGSWLQKLRTVPQLEHWHPLATCAESIRHPREEPGTCV
jgi:putative transposase